MKNSTLASNLLAMNPARNMSRTEVVRSCFSVSIASRFFAKANFRNLTIGFLMALVTFMNAAPAFAQLPFMGDKADEIPQPSPDLAPLPPSAIKQEMKQTIVAPPAPAPVKAAEAPKIPPLPPSKPCTASDVAGVVWKLVHVYEVPVGAETQALVQNPVQYLLLRKNDMYVRLNAGSTEMNEQEVRAAMEPLGNGALYQYVLQPGTGMVYFYQDRVVVDTQVCFVVTNARGEFLTGQMMLLPPEGQSTQRVVKVYDRITAGRPANAARRGVQNGGFSAGAFTPLQQQGQR